MNQVIKYWLILFLFHVILAVVPGIFASNKLTAMIPLFSIFLPLEFFDYLNIPVWGEVQENMFMAPVTLLGWLLVIGTWSLIHYCFAIGIDYLTSRYLGIGNKNASLKG